MNAALGMSPEEPDGNWKVVRSATALPINRITTPGEEFSLGELSFSIPLDGEVDRSRSWLVFEITEEALDLDRVRPRQSYVYGPKDIFRPVVGPIRSTSSGAAPLEPEEYEVYTSLIRQRFGCEPDVIIDQTAPETRVAADQGFQASVQTLQDFRVKNQQAYPLNLLGSSTLPYRRLPSDEAEEGISWLRFSRVGFNTRKGQALVFVASNVARLDGGNFSADFYLLERSYGAWIVVAEGHGWSSSSTVDYVLPVGDLERRLSLAKHYIKNKKFAAASVALQDILRMVPGHKGAMALSKEVNGKLEAEPRE